MFYTFDERSISMDIIDGGWSFSSEKHLKYKTSYAT